MPIIQREVYTFKDQVWNVHRIRAQKNTELPNGIANHIYDFPGEYGLCECCKYPQLIVGHQIFIPKMEQLCMQFFPKTGQTC